MRELRSSLFAQVTDKPETNSPERRLDSNRAAKLPRGKALGIHTQLLVPLTSNHD